LKDIDNKLENEFYVEPEPVEVEEPVEGDALMEACAKVILSKEEEESDGIPF